MIKIHIDFYFENFMLIKMVWDNFLIWETMKIKKILKIGFINSIDLINEWSQCDLYWSLNPLLIWAWILIKQYMESATTNRCFWRWTINWSSDNINFVDQKLNATHSSILSIQFAIRKSSCSPLICFVNLFHVNRIYFPIIKLFFIMLDMNTSWKWLNTKIINRIFPNARASFTLTK